MLPRVQPSLVSKEIWFLPVIKFTEIMMHYQGLCRRIYPDVEIEFDRSNDYGNNAASRISELQSLAVFGGDLSSVYFFTISSGCNA